MDTFTIISFNDTDVILTIYFGSQAIKEDLNSAQPNLQAIKATADELEQVSTQYFSKRVFSLIDNNTFASKMLRNCSSDGVKVKHVFYFSGFFYGHTIFCVVTAGLWCAWTHGITKIHGGYHECCGRNRGWSEGQT